MVMKKSLVAAMILCGVLCGAVGGHELTVSPHPVNADHVTIFIE